MSVTSSVFIRTSDPRDEVVRVLGLLGLTFKTERNRLDEEIFVAHSLGMVLVLVPEPDFDDDQGIELSRFDFQLSLQALWPDDHTDDLRQAAALFIQGRLASTTAWESLAVEDLQEVLAEVGQ
ncbi:MAG: hypothetical protein IT370_32280 [Deltaproteobacteria bacterium]|nr:hypothetical protein [Deltaproteobacteria bacterium]